jgi:hypothetical protein
MNGVATKIAQEISVLFEHRHLDPGPREQKTQHRARGSATGDATGNVLH